MSSFFSNITNEHFDKKLTTTCLLTLSSLSGIEIVQSQQEKLDLCVANEYELEEQIESGQSRNQLEQFEVNLKKTNNSNNNNSNNNSNSNSTSTSSVDFSNWKELDYLRELVTKSKDGTTKESKIENKKYSILTIMEITSLLKHIYLPEQSINIMDPLLLTFENIVNLNLSCNKIKTIGPLPESIETLNLCGNQIMELDIKAPMPNLKFLNVAYNRITHVPDNLNIQISLLISLDLSYNNILQLEDCCEEISYLEDLEYLFLMGNPIALLPYYRYRIMDSLQQIKHLDDIVISDEEIIKMYGKDFTEENSHDVTLNINIPVIENIPEDPFADMENVLNITKKSTTKMTTSRNNNKKTTTTSRTKQTSRQQTTTTSRKGSLTKLTTRGRNSSFSKSKKKTQIKWDEPIVKYQLKIELPCNGGKRKINDNIGNACISGNDSCFYSKEFSLEENNMENNNNNNNNNRDLQCNINEFFTFPISIQLRNYLKFENMRIDLLKITVTKENEDDDIGVKKVATHCRLVFPAKKFLQSKYTMRGGCKISHSAQMAVIDEWAGQCKAPTLNIDVNLNEKYISEKQIIDISDNKMVEVENDDSNAPFFTAVGNNNMMSLHND